MDAHEISQHGEVGELQSSVRDRDAMLHMGKKQQFRRIFGFLPTLAMSLTILASWESVSSALGPGLTNGGPVALSYGALLAIGGSLALAASLAEMASMCPIAGAQYHWTWMFAPRRMAPFITWMQGWITVFAWQATITSVVYLTATQIQGLMILNYDSYDPKRWHGTLMMWAVLALLILVNVFCIRVLPLFESIGGIVHVVLFIVIIVVLPVLAPKKPASFVFTDFINGGGWQSDGVSWCIGLLTIVWGFVGFDGAIHMSEEVRDSPQTVPRVIVMTIAINGVLVLGFVITLLFCVGNVQEAIFSKTGYPIIEVFMHATGSKAAATAMESGIIFIAGVSGFALLASVSRLTFAFARDGGLPYSNFFAYVSPRYLVPIHSIMLVSVVVVLLSLINLGSSIALNAILSLSTISLYVSYIIPISMLLLKRLRGEAINFGPFHLGRFGLWINLCGLCFATFLVIFLPFPAVPSPDAAGMNYAGPVFLGLVFIALVDWFARGRKFYNGPTRESTADASSSPSIDDTGVGEEVFVSERKEV